jgi:hypothetical protein
MNLGALIGNDTVMKAMKPQIEKLIEPMFLEVRTGALAKIAGPAPEPFLLAVRRRFAFSPDDVEYLWRCAVDAVL